MPSEQDSRLTQRLRGVRERTIDDIPERDGLRGDEGARPNREAPVPRRERLFAGGSEG